MPAFIAEMAEWLKDGRIKYRETIVEGIENMPRALVGLFRGENFGKLIARRRRRAELVAYGAAGKGVEMRSPFAALRRSWHDLLA